MVYFAPNPTQDSVQTWMRNWLLSVLPANTPVLAGNVGRIPQPNGSDYVIFTTLFRNRLATNEYTYSDCSFLAFIDVPSTTMTVTQMLLGSITVGNQIFGSNAPANAVITGQLTGTPGGVGTYSVLPAWSVTAGTKLACGVRGIQESTEVHMQVDVYSALPLDSADMIQTVAQLWRSEAAADYWDDMTNGQAQVLYADEPKCIVFHDAEQQPETRWITTLRMQVNANIILPQEFADQLTPTIIVAQTQGS